MKKLFDVKIIKEINNGESEEILINEIEIKMFIISLMNMKLNNYFNEKFKNTYMYKHYLNECR